MQHNLRKYELIGIFMIFLAGTSLGIGLYIVAWGANRPLFYGSLGHLIKGNEYLIFPLFFGTAAVLWVMGQIELKEALPGKKKKW